MYLFIYFYCLFVPVLSKLKKYHSTNRELSLMGVHLRISFIAIFFSSSLFMIFRHSTKHMSHVRFWLNVVKFYYKYKIATPRNYIRITRLRMMHVCSYVVCTCIDIKQGIRTATAIMCVRYIHVHMKDNKRKKYEKNITKQNKKQKTKTKTKTKKKQKKKKKTTKPLLCDDKLDFFLFHLYSR